MKITVHDERVFPTLGVLAAPGDEIELPDDTQAEQAGGVLPSPKKQSKKEMSDGSAPQS